MKKKDLKSGWSVELRNSNKLFVLLNHTSNDENNADILVGSSGELLHLDNYNEDLTYNDDTINGLDIVKIFRPSLACFALDMDEHDLIWEKEEKSLEDLIKEFQQHCGSLKQSLDKLNNKLNKL